MVSPDTVIVRRRCRSLTTFNYLSGVSEMTTLNNVYTKSATIGLDADVKFDAVVSEAIQAGILSVTDKARRVDDVGNLIKIDHKSISDECNDYIELTLPTYVKAILKQYNKAADGLAKAAELYEADSVEFKAADSLYSRAKSRLPLDENGCELTTELSFVYMSTADFKKWEHPHKKELGEYRDNKRGILRMNFRRLVEAAHDLVKSQDKTEETWSQVLARTLKSFTGEKIAPKWHAVGITSDDIVYAFLILEKGRAFAESREKQQAAKNGKAAAKRAAQQAA